VIMRPYARVGIPAHQVGRQAIDEVRSADA
jgi:hypothetical protein